MQVLPKNDEVRKLLKHPVAKGFRAEGPSEWPDDSFTARRIADGDITVVEEQQPAGAAAPVMPPPQTEESPEEIGSGRGKRK
jgi:hypothetical protein